MSSIKSLSKHIESPGCCETQTIIGLEMLSSYLLLEKENALAINAVNSSVIVLLSASAALYMVGDMLRPKNYDRRLREVIIKSLEHSFHKD